MTAAEPDESLSDLFGSAARSLRRRTRAALEPLGITPSLARALGTLPRLAPVRITALAEHLGIAARTATELVDELESRGLATRRPDPADRRAVLVELTPAGARAAGAMRAAREGAAEHFFGTLTATDRRDLARILRALRD